MAAEPHPQVQVLLDMLDEQNSPPTYGVTPETAREQFAELTEMMESEPVDETQDFDIEGPGGPIPVRAYIPEGEGPHPMLVFYHGGGFVIGNIESHDNVCSALCNRAEVVVLSVDYRLAPEHPFPAAVHDAYAALEWASEYGAEVSGDPDRIAVGGDSAGGNLSAAVTLRAKDEGGPEIAHQALVYPAVGSHVIHEFDSYQENAEGYFLESDSMDWFVDKYLEDDIQARNEYFAPLLSRDLSGLPPATILTAGFDPLRDEGADYADRLSEAGVDVHHENYEEMIHGFVQMLDMIDRAEDAIELLAEELQASF